MGIIQFQYLGETPYTYANTVDVASGDVLTIVAYFTSPTVNHQMMVRMVNDDGETVIIPLSFFETDFKRIVK